VDRPWTSEFLGASVVTPDVLEHDVFA
jgi:hypothetical protein